MRVRITYIRGMNEIPPTTPLVHWEQCDQRTDGDYEKAHIRLGMSYGPWMKCYADGTVEFSDRGDASDPGKPCLSLGRTTMLRLTAMIEEGRTLARMAFGDDWGQHVNPMVTHQAVPPRGYKRSKAADDLAREIYDQLVRVLYEPSWILGVAGFYSAKQSRFLFLSVGTTEGGRVELSSTVNAAAFEDRDRAVKKIALEAAVELEKKNI